MPPAGMTAIPSGLAETEASLATNLVVATPTEQVICCWARTWARISSPIAAGRPSRRTAPDTSRNASSRASGSTSGVIVRNRAMTSRDTTEYSPRLGGRTMACGHSRRARAIGMAEVTP